MIRLVLHILIALLTFTVGLLTWDIHQAFANHGFAPIRRIFRVKAQPLSEVISKPLARLSPHPSVEPSPLAGSTTTPDVVLVRFTTDLRGRVKDASAMSGDQVFHQRAVEGAYRMRFRRRRYRGYRVGTTGIIVYGFTGGRRVLREVHEGPAVEFTCGDVIQN